MITVEILEKYGYTKNADDSSFEKYGYSFSLENGKVFMGYCGGYFDGQDDIVILEQLACYIRDTDKFHTRQLDEKFPTKKEEEEFYMELCKKYPLVVIKPDSIIL